MPRYIDANELYKKIFPLDVVDKRRYSINAKAVAEAIVDMPTADVVPRAEWISVEERLPEPNEECLVSARVGDRVVIDLGEIVRYYDGRTNKYGYTWMITNDWDEGEGCEITHWMPLPEPPQMKGSE